MYYLGFYLDVYFPRCSTTRERKTKITLSWQHIQFPSPVHRLLHDEVIKWKHFPQYWPLVPGIHWSPVNSQHKGQWHRALMCSLICTWIHSWVSNREAGDLRRHRTHYDVTVMSLHIQTHPRFSHVFFPNKTINAPDWNAQYVDDMIQVLMVWIYQLNIFHVIQVSTISSILVNWLYFLPVYKKVSN